MQYDIFLSYRRDGGYETAKHLYDLLVRDGYSVSFDIDTLKNGDFDKQLLDRIDACTDFILIVDKNCFDRTLNGTCLPEQDWLRCELSHALLKNKNIIPVFLAGVTAFPENLPKDINGVVLKNGPKYNRDYFDAFYEKLKEDFLLSKSNVLDCNKFTLKRLLIIIGILLLLSISGVAIYSSIERRHSLNDFDGLVLKADNLIVAEQKRLAEEGSEKFVNTKTISDTYALYMKALEVDIKDDVRKDEVNTKVVILSQVLDSCQLYNRNGQLIQQYMLDQRVVSAELLRLRQSQLEKNIASIILSL